LKERGGGYYGSWRVLFCVGESDTYPLIGRGEWSVTAMFCVSVRASLTGTWGIP
jgi:hypothetical protein